MFASWILVKPRHLNCSEPSDFKYTATLTQLSFCVRNRIIFPMGSCLFYISAAFLSTITPPLIRLPSSASPSTFRIPFPSYPLLFYKGNRWVSISNLNSAAASFPSSPPGGWCSCPAESCFVSVTQHLKTAPCSRFNGLSGVRASARKHPCAYVAVLQHLKPAYAWDSTDFAEGIPHDWMNLKSYSSPAAGWDTSAALVVTRGLFQSTFYIRFLLIPFSNLWQLYSLLPKYIALCLLIFLLLLPSADYFYHCFLDYVQIQVC
jgi:hypothetical protein